MPGNAKTILGQKYDNLQIRSIIPNPKMHCNFLSKLIEVRQIKLKDFQNDFYILKISAFTLYIRLVLDYTFIRKHGGGR